MANVIECSDDREYQAAIDSAGDSLILAEFYAEWTTPSQVISRELELLRISFPNLTHIRLNFDTCPVTFT
jgi:hypothetical protein